MKLIFDIIKIGNEQPLKRNFHFDMVNGVIGRSASASWQLNDQQNFISGEHIHIEYKDSMYFIKDISTNGTFLKYPYKKLPKNIAIKINSTDVFIIGDYEIQARFIDNDYSKKDVITNQNLIEKKPEQIAKAVVTKQLIPDDDFLLEDTSVMDNTFIEQEEEVYDSSVMDLFKDNEPKNDFEEIYDFENINPTVTQQDTTSEIISTSPLNDHFSIPKIEEKIIEVKEIEEEVVENTLPEPIKVQAKKETKPKNNSTSNNIDILLNKFDLNSQDLTADEEKHLLEEVGDIVLNSLDGLKTSLDLKDKIKKDIMINNPNPAYDDANPIRLGKHAVSLLKNENKNGIKVSDALKKSFSELDGHNIALHGSSKKLVNIAANKFSPKTLESQFEKRGQLSALMPRKYQMWDAYVTMFKEMSENSEFGVDLISKDFSNEYNNIFYTIKLTSI